jgi:hypothetical protein
MSDTILSESVVSTFGPLPSVNVSIDLPPQPSSGQITCPPGLTFEQKERLLRAAKKQINAELYEMHKTMELVRKRGRCSRALPRLEHQSALYQLCCS